MDVEPITGSKEMNNFNKISVSFFLLKLAVMNGSRRMQINLNIVNDKDIE